MIRIRCSLSFAGLLAFALGPGLVSADAAGGSRHEVSLDGTWLFQTNGAPATDWKRVSVPCSFQSHEGTNFHGIGWYRKEVGAVKVSRGYRALVHFEAAATEAEVWWNGHRVGAHLGGWTPFRCDVTEWVSAATNEVRVRLDEKVGHNTQGFLPIVAPHFGGLWQGVKLLLVPDTYMDDLRVLAIGERTHRVLRVDVPIVGGDDGAAERRQFTEARIKYRLKGEKGWTQAGTAPDQAEPDMVRFRVPVPNAKDWSPEAPNLYEVEIALARKGDCIRTRAAFRSIEAVGSQLRLNGQPLSVRGLLNWGYSPPLVEPNPGPKAWAGELELARKRGFNLMKYCLWVPPKRYLEMADESGMLTWMEYPTWHPDFSEKHLGNLRKEFAEFFEYDRNHPSVILRSLTCETGPSADIKVIKSLYDTAHRLIPGALVEDDSSWIGWNRVHDFYDDHPYGNNHTWVPTLQGFKDYIAARTNKPLVLGEAMSADSWLDRPALLKHFGNRRPWWAPAPLDSAGEWIAERRAQSGTGGLEELLRDSLHYGMLMRKYQAETFRREIPDGGYVISVIRDVPKASMGLVDYLGRPKWTQRDWTWHGETICLLQTPGDCRSFPGGQALEANLLLSHFGNDILRNAQVELTLAEADGPRAILHRKTEAVESIRPGTLIRPLKVKWPLPEVQTPVRMLVRARAQADRVERSNAWPIWVVPGVKTSDSAPQRYGASELQVHRSLDERVRAELFPGAVAFDGADSRRKGAGEKLIVAASVFDDELAAFLESGGRVLFLPNGQRHSLPFAAHWFLRGAPYIPEHPLQKVVPRDFFLELQHFDLASNVVPNLPQLEHVDPILLLWDTHDLSTVKTHGLVFETRIGQGRLLVSGLNHGGTNNPAGRWTLSRFIEHLETGTAPARHLPEDVWEYLKARLHAVQVNLADQEWQFRADPEDSGLKNDWHQPSLSESAEWKPIKIGAWWESQGYRELDGWAWYRLWVEPPTTSPQGKVYLTFEGVDDIYELYVNGQLVAKGGDLARHRDTLSERVSHDITGYIKPNERALVAVRVHDWYGAGGIFRPVTLGSVPLRPELDFLK